MSGSDYDYAECRDCDWMTVGPDSLSGAADHEELGHGVTVSIRLVPHD